MKKRTRKKKATKPQPPKPKPIPMVEITEDLKPFVRKKFRVRPRTGAWVLVVHTVDGVDAVATLKPSGMLPQTAIPTIVREFPVPSKTTLSVDMWRTCQRQLAIWYGRWVARHPHPPSARNERSRRRRIWKKAARRYAEHAATKSVLQHVGAVPKPPTKKRMVPQSAFICTYNPKAAKDDRTVFEIHRIDCDKLDQHRNRAVRHGGDTWVIEAKSAKEAAQLQLAEFEGEDMGYDKADFLIHECETDEYINSKGAGRR
jgi:hypothetical protein